MVYQRNNCRLLIKKGQTRQHIAHLKDKITGKTNVTSHTKITVHWVAGAWRLKSIYMCFVLATLRSKKDFLHPFKKWSTMAGFIILEEITVSSADFKMCLFKNWLLQSLVYKTWRNGERTHPQGWKRHSWHTPIHPHPLRSVKVEIQNPASQTEVDTRVVRKSVH